MNTDTFRMLARMAVSKARTITDDQEALEVKTLFKEFDKQIGNELKIGEFIQCDFKLFRVLQTHIAQEQYRPGVGTESLFVVIDKEHEGSLMDPIPYTQNMELFNGKFYVQNGIKYVCIRDSGAPVYHDLSALIGLYVELATITRN